MARPLTTKDVDRLWTKLQTTRTSDDWIQFVYFNPDVMMLEDKERRFLPGFWPYFVNRGIFEAFAHRMAIALDSSESVVSGSKRHKCREITYPGTGFRDPKQTTRYYGSLELGETLP